jgi:hypothetical protein
MKNAFQARTETKMAARWAWWGLVPPMVRGAGAAVRPAVRAVTSRVAPSCAAAAGATAYSRSAPVPRFPCLAGLGVRLPIVAGRLWARAASGEHRRALSAPAAELGRGPAPATVFAVAEIGGKQYKVTVDDSIVTENMVGRSVGERRLHCNSTFCICTSPVTNSAPCVHSAPLPLDTNCSLLSPEREAEGLTW